MRLVLTRFALPALLISLPAAAVAQWSDNFDSYANGSGIIGQGDWEGWDGSAAPNATVTNVLSTSAPNALEVGPIADVVQRFSGVDSDMWIFTAWQYIPGNATGDTYFILLNAYTPDGNGTNENWSTQLRFGGGVVESEFEAVTLPLLVDQWVEIRVVIDFTSDTQSIFYGGAPLSTKSWTQGVSGAGTLNLAAVDLFGNGASPVYYDDFELEHVGSTPTVVESWGGIKDRFRP
jgi:hypothetical protein